MCSLLININECGIEQFDFWKTMWNLCIKVCRFDDDRLYITVKEGISNIVYNIMLLVRNV